MGCHSAEEIRPLPDIDEVGIGEDAVRIAVVLFARVDLHQLFRSPHGNAGQQDGVDDGEDGGVGPDAEGQGEHRDGGEARALGHPAEGVLEVLYQSVHGIGARDKVAARQRMAESVFRLSYVVGPTDYQRGGFGGMWLREVRAGRGLAL